MRHPVGPRIVLACTMMNYYRNPVGQVRNVAWQAWAEAYLRSNRKEKGADTAEKTGQGVNDSTRYAVDFYCTLVVA